MARAKITQEKQKVEEKAVGMNFEGENYSESFPKLEKRGRIPRREKRSTAITQIISQETAAAEKPKPAAAYWTRYSTVIKPVFHETEDGAAPEKQQGEVTIAVANQILAQDSNSIDTAADDQQEREETHPDEEAQKSNDHAVEERETIQEQDQLEINVGSDDQHQKSDDPVGKTAQEAAATEEQLNQEEKLDAGVVYGTQNSVENPQKSTLDEGENAALEKEASVESESQGSADDEGETSQENPAEERETTTSTVEKVVFLLADDDHGDDDYGADYLFFGTIPTLIPWPRPKNIILSNYSILHETAAAAADQVMINQQEREDPVDQEPSEERDFVETPPVLEANSEKRDLHIQETKLEEQKSDGAQITTSNQETTAAELHQVEKEAGIVSAPQNFQKASNNDEEEGSAQESTTAEDNGTFDNEPPRKSSDESEVTEGGERQIQELKTEAVIRDEKEEEIISFEGNNYDDHFPRIERKVRITKRSRGDFRR